MALGARPHLCPPHAPQLSLRNSAERSLGTKTSHFTPEGTEAQRGQASGPRPHSDLVTHCRLHAIVNQHPVSQQTSTNQGDKMTPPLPSHVHACTHVRTRACTRTPAPQRQPWLCTCSGWPMGAPSALTCSQSPHPCQGRPECMPPHPEGSKGSPRSLPVPDLIPAADRAGEGSAGQGSDLGASVSPPSHHEGVKTPAPPLGHWGWGRVSEAVYSRGG